VTYVSNDDLRSTSLLRVVQDADDDTLDGWTEIARSEIDQFCSRDFVFEPGVTRDIFVTSPLIVLDKEVSNITSVISSSADGTLLGPVDFATQLRVMSPGNRQIRYPGMTSPARPYPIPPRILAITADWGTVTPPSAVVTVFKQLVDRIAAQSHEDDVLQINAPYAKQDDGDGYNYDLGNGTLRNLLRPQDRAKLWKHVNHGRVVA
jgi:hypothetical protein